MLIYLVAINSWEFIRLIWIPKKKEEEYINYYDLKNSFLSEIFDHTIVW